MKLPVRHKDSGSIGRMIRREHEEGFWGAGILPFLILSAGYKNVFSS